MRGHLELSRASEIESYIGEGSSFAIVSRKKQATPTSWRCTDRPHGRKTVSHERHWQWKHENWRSANALACRSAGTRHCFPGPLRSPEYLPSSCTLQAAGADEGRGAVPFCPSALLPRLALSPPPRNCDAEFDDNVRGVDRPCSQCDACGLRC